MDLYKLHLTEKLGNTAEFDSESERVQITQISNSSKTKSTTELYSDRANNQPRDGMNRLGDSCESKKRDKFDYQTLFLSMMTICCWPIPLSMSADNNN